MSTTGKNSIAGDKKGAPHMELLIALGAFVLVDILAIRYGTDSRPLPDTKTKEERAAIRSGN